jgi:cell division protein FtsN
VRIGPFKKPEDMNRSRALLAENGIQARVVKLKDGAPN